MNSVNKLNYHSVQTAASLNLLNMDSSLLNQNTVSIIRSPNKKFYHMAALDSNDFEHFCRLREFKLPDNGHHSNDMINVQPCSSQLSSHPTLCCYANTKINCRSKNSAGKRDSGSSGNEEDVTSDVASTGHESTAIDQIWDGYQAPLYVAISDDSIEEKLDATHLFQSEWQPMTDEFMDFSDFGNDYSLQHLPSELDSDSDAEEVLHLIKESSNALRLTRSSLNQLRLRKMQSSLHREPLATCSTNISCLRDLLGIVSQKDWTHAVVSQLSDLLKQWEDVESEFLRQTSQKKLSDVILDFSPNAIPVSPVSQRVDNNSLIMALRGENGWQSEKTLVECMRYMLDNEIATDVCFEVGPPDGATVRMRAHKFMLISRSAVFKALFSSGMAECQSGPDTTIRVEDIDAAIFKDLLLYIYCETVSVNMETAASLIYAANKYMLPKLVRECGKCLSEGLSVSNVAQVLEHSLLFDDSELQNKCLTFIGQNVNTVLTGKQILSVSPQTMETILQMEKIMVKEIVIYEMCIKWAKHQLQIQRSTENPTDQQIREILGGLLYEIRFPIMEPAEFAEISECKNILTAEEKLSILYFFTTKKKGSQLLFPTERRLSEELWIDRAVTCVTNSWRSTPIADAISFTTNQDILLTGVGLYTAQNGPGYDVDVEILQASNSLFKKKLTIPSRGDSNQFKVSFDGPIFIRAGSVHSVKALSYDTIGHYGSPCHAVCTKGKFTFTFSRHPESHTSTHETCGQIPRFYFRYA